MEYILQYCVWLLCCVCLCVHVHVCVCLHVWFGQSSICTLVWKLHFCVSVCEYLQCHLHLLQKNCRAPKTDREANTKCLVSLYLSLSHSQGYRSKCQRVRDIVSAQGQRGWLSGGGGSLFASSGNTRLHGATFYHMHKPINI